MLAATAAMERALGTPYVPPPIAREDAASVEIPPTIQGLLTARLDQLPAHARRVLQEAAVLGPRFDLELLQKVSAAAATLDAILEALLEILNGEIRIMSHSYRQDEILMLMRLAEEFDVRIRAFHHSVEAYKVAPELARHGAGAVVWSDWSSFKIEAYDATTYNARLLLEAGVLTSLHSDNSQLASRMNWEAAKMLRAGMDEVDALALVTINTAKLLGIDDRVGSLEPGKDGDFVIWNAHPLSSFTVAQQTWVDGRRYYDIEEDRRLRAEVERERAEIIQLILDERNGGGEER